MVRKLRDFIIIFISQNLFCNYLVTLCEKCCYLIGNYKFSYNRHNAWFNQFRDKNEKYQKSNKNETNY